MLWFASRRSDSSAWPMRARRSGSVTWMLSASSSTNWRSPSAPSSVTRVRCTDGRRLAGRRRQRLGDAFGVHDAAGHRARSLHRDLDALQAVQVIDRRAQRLGAERHVAEARARVVASRQFHGADAAGAVEHHERGQHVVHLIERHVEAERRRAVHVGLVFEVADAGGRQHHPLQREIRGEGRRGREQQDRQDQALHCGSPVVVAWTPGAQRDNSRRCDGG